jgi:hypothetical protein
MLEASSKFPFSAAFKSRPPMVLHLSVSRCSVLPKTRKHAYSIQKALLDWPIIQVIPSQIHFLFSSHFIFISSSPSINLPNNNIHHLPSTSAFLSLTLSPVLHSPIQQQHKQKPDNGILAQTGTHSNPRPSFPLFLSSYTPHRLPFP